MAIDLNHVGILPLYLEETKRTESEEDHLLVELKLQSFLNYVDTFMH